MVDFALQRLNMVESQVRPSDLTDRRIANAMLHVARENYLPEPLQGVAYSDGELTLGAELSGRQLLAPRTVAQMLQALDLNTDDIVLLVGGGSGYEAALVAHLAQTVVVLEEERELATWAENALTGDDESSAVVVQGALKHGYPNEGPYNAILINGGVDDVPVQLLDQLKDGGRLVTILCRDGVKRLARWHRTGEQFALVEKSVAAAEILPAFKKEATFVL